MEEKFDVLDRGGFIEKLKDLVNVISENKQGCCFGLNGFWGSGKSFVLEKFEEEIKEIQSEETGDTKYFVFHYDCWKYDYYEEPAIAIIAAMLDATDRELNVFTSEQRDVVKKMAWETAKETLKVVASELCKNKVGIDLVEIATNTIEERMKEDDNSFDSLYGFKRALEATRKGIQKIADRKAVVIIVDELDRCLPEYTIKVLERLHHIFTDLKNVIVIVSMDKTQIEHSIKEIYGEINVDTYLRKFISFKVNLDNGKAGQYIKKYETYTSMFEFLQGEEQIVEKFFSDIMSGLDIRTQERIFNKAETIHKLICSEEIKDSSIMTFEILFLTIALRTKSNNIEWLVNKGYYPNYEKSLGKNYYNVIKEYEKQVSDRLQSINDNACIRDNIMGKTFFWIASLYDEYQDGACRPYYYGKQAKGRIEIARRFSAFIDNIDCD
mgnify:FL=1